MATSIATAAVSLFRLDNRIQVTGTVDKGGQTANRLETALPSSLKHLRERGFTPDMIAVAAPRRTKNCRGCTALARGTARCSGPAFCSASRPASGS